MAANHRHTSNDETLDEGRSSDSPPPSVNRALEARPAISIRLRIGISMAVCFLLTAAVTVAWIVSVAEVGGSQDFLERVNRYLFELEETRRYEKNFLLYQTNLGDALSHVDTAQQLLHGSREDVRDLVGSSELDRAEQNLGEYEQVLSRLSTLERDNGSLDAAAREALERRLRSYGAQALVDAESFIYRERLRMQTMIRTSRIAGIGTLVLVLLVIAYLSSNLSRQILTPLRRFMDYTKRIAGGDYSPIVPVRRYRDEFSDLALAVNRMLAELQEHQQKLTRTSRMAAVGTLTAGIAHELNNPLNNISLTTEALLEALDDYPAKEKVKMLQDIFTQVERASGTVRNLLDFTRVDHPVFVPVSIEEVASEAGRLVTNEARLNDVEFTTEFPADLPRVQGNPRDLQQVFLNLFLNAIQAMPRGGILKARGQPTADHMVRIDVMDTGEGIPEENLPSLFDPFFTTKEVGHGTGLGLSVSYTIVEKHQGRLEVESEVGRGTTFSLFLPCASTTANANT